MGVYETVFGLAATISDNGVIQGRIPVLLSDDDYDVCVAEAERREARRHARSNRPIGTEGYETHLRGVMSELAAARYYGCDTEPIFAYDEGYDLAMKSKGKWWRLQVKSTQNFNYGIKLACMPSEMKNSDIFLLAAVDTVEGYVELVGLAPTAQLLKTPLTRPKGWRNQNHIIPEYGLKRPKPYTEPYEAEAEDEYPNEPEDDGEPEDVDDGPTDPAAPQFDLPDMPPERIVDWLCENDSWYTDLTAPDQPLAGSRTAS